MSSTSATAAAAAGAADASSHGAWPQPNPRVDKLEKDNRSLQGELMWARMATKRAEGERDDAHAQLKLVVARIASLEREKAVAGWLTAAELVDGFDRALPFGGLDEVATIQEMMHVESRRRSPIADLSSWALVQFDVLVCAMEELARRPLVFDLRRHKSGIESFVDAQRYTHLKGRVREVFQKHSWFHIDRITLVVPASVNDGRHALNVDRFTGLHSEGSPTAQVTTLVLNIVDELDDETVEYWDNCEGVIPPGVGRLLSLFRPAVLHVHYEPRGEHPRAAVRDALCEVGLTLDWPYKLWYYRRSTVVYSGCTPPALRSGWLEDMQANNQALFHSSPETPRWNPFPSKVVFVVGGAHRDGVSWEYVDARDNKHFDPTSQVWIAHLMRFPETLGIARYRPENQDWIIPNKPFRAIAVEIWVAKTAVQRYAEAFKSIPLFSTMENADGDPITWEAVSLEDKTASTAKLDVEIIKGLGGIDGD